MATCPMEPTASPKQARLRIEDRPRDCSTQSHISSACSADGLLGYMWPKWVRSGERSEFRVHSVEQYQLSLWRYGLQKECIGVIGWYDEHGPRAVMQITPDGDFTQTRSRVEQGGLRSTGSYAAHHGSGARGSVLSMGENAIRTGVLISVGRGSARLRRRRSRFWLHEHLECVQQFRRAQQLRQCGPAPGTTDRERAARAGALSESITIWRLAAQGRGVCAAFLRPAGAAQSSSSNPEKSPTRCAGASNAGKRRANGGCWGGWSAKVTIMISMQTRNYTTARFRSMPIEC